MYHLIDGGMTHLLGHVIYFGVIQLPRSICEGTTQYRAVLMT